MTLLPPAACALCSLNVKVEVGHELTVDGPFRASQRALLHVQRGMVSNRLRPCPESE